MNWMIDMNEELKSNKMFGLRNGTIKSFIRKEITVGVAGQMGKWKRDQELRCGHVIFVMPVRH